MTKGADTREAILDATRELLAEGGVHGLTVEGVAARAGRGQDDRLPPLALEGRVGARGPDRLGGGPRARARVPRAGRRGSRRRVTAAGERGIERGELRPDADYELTNELLFGPVYYRLLLSGAPLGDDLAARVVGAVWPAFAAAGAASVVEA